MNVKFRRNGYKKHSQCSQFDYIIVKLSTNNLFTQEELTKKKCDTSVT